MKCPACGNEITDDVVYCPRCGKHIPENPPAVNAGGTGASSPRTDISGGKMCPRCQIPLPSGAAFCGNCGAAADGSSAPPQGGNPYNGRMAGSMIKSRPRSNFSEKAVAVMNDMDFMMYWIIGYLVAQFIPGLNMLSLIAFIYILVQTPSLADKCAGILNDDRDLMSRISRVRPRVKALWILLALTIVLCGAGVVMMVAGAAISREEGSVLAILGILLLLIMGVLLIVNLIYQILLTIDFFKVKEGIDRIARDY